MKKTSLKIILAVLCFCIEIQVNATLIKNPEGCNVGVDTCVIKNISKNPAYINFENIKVNLGPSSLMRVQVGEIKLLKGEFIVNCTATCFLKSMYVENIQIGKGSVYIDSSFKKNYIIGLTGEVAQTIRNKGNFSLLPGMFQEIEQGDISGHNVELPQVISDEELSDRLTGLARAPQKLLTRVRSEKKLTVNFIAAEFKKSIQRKVASYKDSIIKNNLRKSKYDNDNYKLRELYRKRNQL